MFASFIWHLTRHPRGFVSKGWELSDDQREVMVSATPWQKSILTNQPSLLLFDLN